MKRTPICPESLPFPDSIKELLRGATVYDSSCSADARVYFIDRDEGFFLKCASKNSLRTEAAMTSFFHQKGLSAEVIAYESLDRDYLVTRAVKGADCLDKQYLDDPKRLSETMGLLLRQLHETDCASCPVADHTAGYIAAAEENRRLGKWHPSRLPEDLRCCSADEVWAMARTYSKELKTDLLIHGDYCLPNILLRDWKPAGFIDVGSGGIGDRHIDLYWGSWSLNFNLKSDRWCSHFLDAYGRESFQPELLRTIAALEAFG